MAYLSFGGHSATGGVARYTRLNNADLLQNIARPAVGANGGRRYMAAADWAAVRARQALDAERLVSATDRLPRDAYIRGLYRSAFASAEALKVCADAIPPETELEQPVEYESTSGNTYGSDLRRQGQLTVLAFRTGVSVSADLWLGGFDTHATHDPDHEWLLANLTDGVDYLWDYAEQHGVAGRLVVVMGSDFGRTNFYNAQKGKDHWPIGSFVVMEKNQSWTNRAVGETDGLHFAQKINATTLERDDVNGAIIYPKHVHKALRRLPGGGGLARCTALPPHQRRGLRVLRVGRGGGEARCQWFETYMPTVLRHGPYRLYFYSNDGDEPLHVHVERDGDVAKLWVDPVRVQRSGGFSRTEILRITRVVRDHREQIMEAWDDHFGA